MLRLTQVFVVLLAVLTVVAASDGTDRNQSVQQAVESSGAVATNRDTRAARWTPFPTPAEVKLFTLRTELVSKIFRSLIRFERRWYDLMSASSVSQVAGFLAAGVAVTFLLLFVPLFVALNAPAAALAGRRKRDAWRRDATHNIDQLTHVDFALDNWWDAMTRWALDSRPSSEHFRCCFLPTSARCFPETRSFKPCPPRRHHRHVSIGRDFRLAFHP